MWIHVIDYTNKKMWSIGLGTVTEEDLMHSEEVYYAKVVSTLGHTNFHWTFSESNKVEVLTFTEEACISSVSDLEMEVGTRSEDCYVEKLIVPISTDIIRTLKKHRKFLIENKDVSTLRTYYSFTVDDPCFLVGGSYIDVFANSIYLGAYHKHNTECYFESVELTIEELEKKLSDA